MAAAQNLVDYRCKLAGEESLDPHFSNRQTSQLHKYREHKTQTFHSFLLCVSILNICMLQLYILTYSSTYSVTMAKDAMVSTLHKQTLVCNMERFSEIPNKPLTQNTQKDSKKIRLIQCFFMLYKQEKGDVETQDIRGALNV